MCKKKLDVIGYQYIIPFHVNKAYLGITNIKTVTPLSWGFFSGLGILYGEEIFFSLFWISWKVSDVLRL